MPRYPVGAQTAAHHPPRPTLQMGTGAISSEEEVRHGALLLPILGATKQTRQDPTCLSTESRTSVGAWICQSVLWTGHGVIPQNRPYATLDRHAGRGVGIV